MDSGLPFAVSWLAFVLLIGVISAPLTVRLFPRQPTVGVPFAIPFGLGSLTLITYWLGRISLTYAPIVAIILIGVVAMFLHRSGDDELPLRAYSGTALVFTGGMGLVLLVQSVTPAITASGESFWNFALIQSLLRTTVLPPQDPWFAGEPVRYYYGGHLLVASLANLLDTPGRYAFALGKAVVFGALLTASYGLAGSIAITRDVPRRTAGLLGVFFIGLASNFYTPIWAVLAILPDSLAEPIATVMTTPRAAPSGEGSLSLLDPAHFSFTNTDFPAYTVYLSGIHPHWVSPVFLLLLVGLLVAYVGVPVESRQRRLGLLALASPFVGLIALINTWSLPTAVGLVALVVAFAPAQPLTLVMEQSRIHNLSYVADWLTRIAGGIGTGVLVGAIGIVWVAPYFVRGLAGSPELGVLPARSGAWYFVIAYGGYLLVFVVYLAVKLHSIQWSARALIAVGLIGVGLLGIGWVGSFPGLVFLGPLVLVGLYLNTRDRPNLTTLLIIAGAGIALLVELVYVSESAEPGRFNTVYKAYMQTWVLWGAAAGVALAALCHVRNSNGQWPEKARVLASVVILVLSIYSLAGVGSHVSHGVQEDVSLSIDGLAYLSDDHPDYAAAISWLAEHRGQPTIVSAPVSENRLYQFNASPAASLTGIPTLIGWNHEADYRGSAVYEQRVQVVDTIYAGTEKERAWTLRNYNVTFIWVGPAEHERYRLIDYSREPGISVAFNEGDITIYRVTEPELVGG